MNEAYYYPVINAALIDMGATYLKIVGTPFQKGHPDYVFVWKGVPGHMEVKLDRVGRKGTRTPLQKMHLDDVRIAGGLGFVLCFLASTKHWEIHETPHFDNRNKWYKTAPLRGLSGLLKEYCTETIQRRINDGYGSLWLDLANSKGGD